ncbi:MAG TPA: Plug domain-containing protein, partial [Spirochaetota bacterium]|nr:Plug domain-containing protein [Spirochaetota bacterium]
MIKTVFRLLVLTLCIAVPVSHLYPQKAAPQKEDPAAGKQGTEKQKKQIEDEGKDNEAAEKKSGGEVTLKEIVVKGEQFLKKSPYTINVVNSNDIEKQGISRTADIIKSVPGVKMHEYDQGGVSNAIAIRGFQSGVHGGDMGVYLDGIPLNEYYGHGGGYADPNILIPMELDKVLVYKGPSSALYGNFSRGGTIVYITKK